MKFEVQYSHNGEDWKIEKVGLSVLIQLASIFLQLFQLKKVVDWEPDVGDEINFMFFKAERIE